MDDSAFRQISRDLMMAAVGHCAPIFWEGRDNAGRPFRHNGTAFFLQTSEALFGVTAAHVLEGSGSWRDSCERHGYSTLLLGAKDGAPVPLDWDARCVDIDLELDLATFAISAREIAATQKVAFVDVGTPPPGAPRNAGWVTYCGYPGVLRRQPTSEVLLFGASTGTGKITAGDEKSLHVQLERGDLEPAFGIGVPPENFNFGGLSGGPMFRNFVGPDGPFLSLTGVVISGPNTDATSGESIAGFDLVSARPTTFIRPDGSLDIVAWRDLFPLGR